MKNILEMLEQNAVTYADKAAFVDEQKTLTYRQLMLASRAVGTGLCALGTRNKPVAVYLDKGADVIAAMLGVVYSGNFYAVIDAEMPPERICKILSTLQPVAVLTDESHYETALQLGDMPVFRYAQLSEGETDDALLSAVRSEQIDTDPLYTLYTSGSTGVPKGAVLTHRNVLAYSEWVVGEFGIDATTVFGNQTPFYFSMSVTDVFATLRTGATLVIVPKQYFSFPIRLIGFLNAHKINTLYWVPSAIGIVANMKIFDYEMPQYLKRVLFAGEVMPTKQLNYWMDKLGDDVVFANLFGPTEATDICTYFTVNRRFRDDEPLPIGNHCDNCNVFIVNEEGKKAAEGEEGELYIRGSFLSAGYYHNPEKTAEAFVQNPLNDAYPEICYKTGDLVKRNAYGELMYIGRRDYQIKHMGYRIELGEIETAVSSVEGMKECACVYDEANEQIVLFYSATKLKEEALMQLLAGKLNSYLLPNRLCKMSMLPHNQNGKIDRKELKQNLLK